MVAAMTELQADLETHFLVEKDVDLREHFSETNVRYLMNDPRVQKTIEKHKMTILIGLANLERKELCTGPFALDIVYQYFQEHE
jgi:hypothetical protein